MGNKNSRSAYFSPQNWLYGAVSGINGKRYSQLPVRDYEVNDDGTITAYGGTYNISTDESGRKYFDVLIPEYDSKTKTGPYLNRGFDHIDSEGNIIGRGETYNRYYVGNLIPIVNTESVLTELLPTNNTTSTSLPSVVQPLAAQTQVLQKPALKLPVVVPAGQTEGLVKVVDGKTYYEFPGLDPDAINEYIRSMGQTISNDKVYLPPKQTLVLQQTQEQQLQKLDTGAATKSHTPSAEKLIKTTSARPLTTELAGDNAGIFYRAGLNKSVDIYQIPPELAEQIRKNVTKKASSYDDSNDIIFSNVELPNVAYRDSIFYTFDKVDPKILKDTQDLIKTDTGEYYDPQIKIKTAQLSALESLKNKDIKEIFLGNAYVPAQRAGRFDVHGDYIPIENNKVIVRPNSKGILNGGKYSIYRDSGQWFTNFNSVSAKGAGVPLVSWEDATNTYYPKPSVTKEIGEGLKNIGSSFVHDVKSLFRHEKGGQIKYLKFYK